MKIKCPFWTKCGPSVILNYLARQNSQSDYTERICNDIEKYVECKHYKIRLKKEER